MKNSIKITPKFGASSLLLIMCFLSLAVQAQSPTGAAGQTLSGVELRGKVPVNRAPLKVTLPPIETATLPNGLRVVVVENHKVPTFAMQTIILSGGLNDPATGRGIATLTLNLLSQGTTTRASREIAVQIESLGASLGANSGGLASLTSVAGVSGLRINFDQTVDIFADIVQHPAFSAEEIEKYKTVAAAQIEYQHSSSQFIAQETLSKLLYGGHPASLLTIPVETLKKVTSADLAKYHSLYYRPNNALLLVAGDVSLKEILPKIERAFGAWQQAEVPKAVIPNVRPLEQPHITIVDRPGSVQTVFLLGNLGIERTSPDYFPFIVMDQIYGANSSSRLFRNLREEKGYTYGANSSFTTSKFTGSFVSRAEVRNEATTGALKEFMYEMNRLRDEPVSPMDLENAKRALTGSFALSLEQPAQLLQYIVTQKTYDLPADYWARYPQRVTEVTAADVARVARKYVDLPHLQIVAVGDASKIHAALEKYGTVEVMNTADNPATK